MGADRGGCVFRDTCSRYAVPALADRAPDNAYEAAGLPRGLSRREWAAILARRLGDVARTTKRLEAVQVEGVLSRIALQRRHVITF